MKVLKTIIRLLINSSAVIVTISLFIPNFPDISFLCFFQPLIVFYNHYAFKSSEESACYNVLLIISNIVMPIGYKIYYEVIYKSVSHSFSWGAVMSEIGYVITQFLLIGIAVIVLIECFISIGVKCYAERKKRQ